QEYLPNVSKGDKRILAINGKLLPPVLRIPKTGDFKANLTAGGKFNVTKITKKEKIAADEIAAFMKDNGIFLCGMDFIDEKLTEINITAPAGFSYIMKLYKFNGHRLFWDELLKF